MPGTRTMRGAPTTSRRVCSLLAACALLAGSFAEAAPPVPFSPAGSERISCGRSCCRASADDRPGNCSLNGSPRDCCANHLQGRIAQFACGCHYRVPPPLPTRHDRRQEPTGRIGQVVAGLAPERHAPSHSKNADALHQRVSLRGPSVPLQILNCAWLT